MKPFVPPKHATLVAAMLAERGANNSATETEMVPEQALTSVMVTV